MAQQQPSKKQRTQPTYELLYHPGIPGRGEFIRLAFEAKGVPYTDVANEGAGEGYGEVQRICVNQNVGTDGNPPMFGPPALRVSGAGRGEGRSWIISQTPNILWYLGEKLDLAGKDEAEKYWVQQVALTALDLNNEVHDTHHPIAVSKTYEEQKEESLKKAQEFRENRIPKFLSHFEGTLEWNAAAGKHKYLVGDNLTYADTTVWQVLDGLQFAFPKELEARKKEFPMLLGTFYDSVKEHLNGYLSSNRRLQYSLGVFRYYPELDRQ